MGKNPKPRRPALGLSGGRAFNLATAMAGAVLTGILVGYGLDRWRGNAEPFWLPICFFVFLAVGFYQVVKESWK